MKIRTSTLLLASLLTLPACAGEEEAGEDVVLESMEEDEMPMGDMAGMGGMAGMQGDSTLQRMQAHMATMMGMSADSMHAMMPAHRQMAANMIAQMSREMQEMNMAGDEAWTATVDSLRQDLILMPELSPQEMEAFMRAHQVRMNRIMEMHRSMMGNMRM